MEKQVSPGLKTLFLVHGILAGIFGLVYLAIPKVWGDLVNLPMKQPELYRLIGAALWAFASGSWLAYKQTGWENVKIVVQMEIIWTILGALVLLWGLMFAGFPRADWMNVIIFGGFGLAFSYFYFRR